MLIQFGVAKQMVLLTAVTAAGRNSWDLHAAVQSQLLTASV